MSYELIAILMFSLMMLMLMTGQRVFGAIGAVAAISAIFLWGGSGGADIPFSAAMKLMKWYPLLTLPMFIFMGYVLSESRIADDLYRMFHVWMGPVRGGLAIGTIGLMVLISAMNGLSVAGMAIGVAGIATERAGTTVGVAGMTTVTGGRTPVLAGNGFRPSPE